MRLLQRHPTALERAEAYAAGRAPVTKTEWRSAKRRLRDKGKPHAAPDVLALVRAEYEEDIA